MIKDSILGVKVNFLTSEEAVGGVLNWFKLKQKRYIVTPNPEIIVAAQKDSELMKILNESDLSIPDSYRLDWASRILNANFLKKIFLWPFFLFPGFLPNPKPSLTGVDLMFELCKLASEKGLRVGFLGGKEGVAKKASRNLEKTFPRLNIAYSESGGEINSSGEQVKENSYNTKYIIQNTDFLFVGLGHGKQEKWINKNLDKFPAKVFMAVGGAIDYISGEVPRAPDFIRKLGFEWFFRLLMQPWRIKRSGALIKFIFLVLVSGKS